MLIAVCELTQLLQDKVSVALSQPYSNGGQPRYCRVMTSGHYYVDLPLLQITYPLKWHEVTRMFDFLSSCFVNAHDVSEAGTASLIKEDMKVRKPGLLCAFYDCHASCMPRLSYPPRTGFVSTCIYCVLYCLYCVFVLFRLCIFILICFVCTWCKDYCHRVTTQLQLIIIIIIIIITIIITHVVCLDNK
jgi:hypothetical protein